MTVCIDHGSQGLVFAPNPTKGGLYPCFSMVARGIKFTLVIGDSLPDEIREACCVGSTREVIYVTNCESESLDAFGRIYKTAEMDVRLP